MELLQDSNFWVIVLAAPVLAFYLKWMYRWFRWNEERFRKLEEKEAAREYRKNPAVNEE